MIRGLVLFASVFFVGLTTGGAFVVFLVYNPTGISPESYVATMQHAIHVMNPLAVTLNLGLFFTEISAFLVRRDRPYLYLVIGACACILISILVTVFGNWPINDQILTWSNAAPPQEWTIQRDGWWLFHKIRFALLIAAFGLLIIGVLRRTDESHRSL